MGESIVVLCFLVVLSVEDIREKQVHAAILFAFLATGCLYCLAIKGASLGELAGGILTGAAVLAFGICSRGAVGSADGLVFASTGAFLGMEDNLALILLSVMAAGIGGAVAGAFYKRKGEGSLPLIPFITVGMVILMGTGL